MFTRSAVTLFSRHGERPNTRALPNELSPCPRRGNGRIARVNMNATARITSCQSGTIGVSESLELEANSGQLHTRFESSAVVPRPTTIVPRAQRAQRSGGPGGKVLASNRAGCSRGSWRWPPATRRLLRCAPTAASCSGTVAPGLAACGCCEGPALQQVLVRIQTSRQCSRRIPRHESCPHA